MDPRRHREASSLRVKDFVQTVLTCDALLIRGNAALRAQVHDLTELLAAFDLCEIEDAHLNAVRDRAFRRDITPDAELLQVYRVERQLQQEILLSELDEKLIQRTDVGNEQFESCSSVAKRGVELRVEVLERDVANLRLHHNLLLETAPRLKCPAVDSQQTASDAVCPSAAAKVTDTQHRTEYLINQAEHATAKKQQQIIELEKALTMESVKNAGAVDRKSLATPINRCMY